MVPCAGLERKEAKLIFVWSQLIVTDELRRRKRAVGLLFLDFVEVRLLHRRLQSATALVQRNHRPQRIVVLCAAAKQLHTQSLKLLQCTLRQNLP